MNKLIDMARRPSVRRAAIAAYVLCLAALIVVFVFVSMMQVEHAAYIQAAPTLEKDRPNVLRGFVLDAPTGRRISGAAVELDLYDTPYEGEQTLEKLPQLRSSRIARGHTQPSGFVHLTAEVPDDFEAGDHALVMRADGSRIEDFRVGESVEVVERSAPSDYWPAPTDRLGQDDQRRHTTTVPSSSGPIQLEVLPADGRASRGLRSLIYIRTTDRDSGQPVAAQVRFTEADGIREGGLPKELKTDRLGLARLVFVPVTDQTWKLEATALDAPERSPGFDDNEGDPREDEDAQTGTSTATINIKTVPTQVSVQMHDVLAVGGRPVDGAVDSLFDSGGLMVDLYNADDWIEATAFGVRPDRSGIRVEVPELDERALLYRVQVYGSIYDPGGAWDIEYLVAADGTELADYQKAARALAEHLAAHTDEPYFDYLVEANIFEVATSRDQLRRWIEAMLLSVPRHFDSPPILINSQKQAREDLEAWKDDVKDDLIALTALALLIGLAVLGYLVVLGVQSYREQNRLLRDVDFEMSLDNEAFDDVDQAPGELERSIAQGNLVAGLQIFIVVMTIVLFTLGILLLLSYL